MGKYHADNSYPAGEATPIEITASIPVPTLPVRNHLTNSRRYANHQQHNRSEALDTSTHVSSHPSPQYHPRPCSSWYSQPSISHSSCCSNQYQPTSPPPPVPRLTSAALRSLEQRFAVPEKRPEINYYKRPSSSDPWQHSDEEDEDNGEALSPAPTSVRAATPTRRVSVDAYLSVSKRTAVSEYLQDRTWLPSSPSFGQSHSTPLPVGIAVTTGCDGYSAAYGRRRSTLGSIPEVAKQVARKVSLSSPDRSGSRPPRANKNDNRKSVLTARPSRDRTTVNAQSYLLRADAGDFASESEYGYGSEAAQTITEGPTLVSIADQIPSEESGRSSLTKTVSSFAMFGPRKSAPKEAVAVSNVQRFGSNPAVIDGKKSIVGPSGNVAKHTTPVIGIPYENSRVGRSPIHITTVRDLESSTNNPRPIHQPPRSITPAHHRPLPQLNTRLTTSTTRHHRILPPQSKPLQTHTRDPYATSNQGKHLFIGTLRGPTPAGLQSLHDTMDRAITKYGEIEGRMRGCKEVRKWLRYEERNVIEWVLCYVRGRWGVEV